MYVHAAKNNWLARLVVSRCVLVEVAGELISASQDVFSDIAKLATWSANHAATIILRSRAVVIEST
jgi:hypothetical protein